MYAVAQACEDEFGEMAPPAPAVPVMTPEEKARRQVCDGGGEEGRSMMSS